MTGYRNIKPHDEHERRLKGVEAFTFMVALLAASYTILNFLNGQAESIISPLLGWAILSAPIWLVCYFAFCATCHYLFDANVTYDYKRSGFAFVASILTLTVLLDGMEVIAVIPLR